MLSHSIKGVGIDLVELNRVKRLISAHKDKLSRFLHPSEWSLFQKSKSKTKSFALIFAAKEAASKALGITLHHPGSFKAFKVFVKGNKISVRYLPSRAKKVISCLPFAYSESMGIIAFSEE